jgi:glucose-1-phosphate thymidylyltransferase
MQGLILAGGLATRLRPLTLATNKHLLPVYDKPMIYYPIEAMQRAGIKEVLLTTGGESIAQFANLLKSGEEFGMRMYYGVQNNPKGGIADAIALAEEFTNNEPLMVILGDNIFNYDLKPAVDAFKKQGVGAKVFGIHMKMDARHYGVIEVDDAGNVLSIEEKPEHPKSDIAQTGIYIYDQKVFEYIKRLSPSARGELEVTDLNNMYLKEGHLTCEIIDWWVDAGTSYDELLRANNQVAEKMRKGTI